jgi:hypothetical protein
MLASPNTLAVEEETDAYASTSNAFMLCIADELSLMKAEQNGIKTSVSIMWNNQTLHNVTANGWHRLRG